MTYMCTISASGGLRKVAAPQGSLCGDPVWELPNYSHRFGSRSGIFWSFACIVAVFSTLHLHVCIYTCPPLRHAE